MTTPFLYIPTFAPVFNGASVPNGLLYTYEAGTTNPKPTFQDAAGLQPNTNPVQLDITGAATVRLEPGSYHFVLTDSTATTVLWDQDFYNAPYLTAADLSALLHSTTSQETNLGVIPSDFSYLADPYIDPRRYGADPTGNIDSTVAVQTAIYVAYATKGCVWIGNQCNYLVGQLSLTLTGNHTNDGLHIMGSSVNGSRLTQNGTPSAILALTGSTVLGNPQESPVLLDNFSIIGSGTGANGNVGAADGVALTGLAGVILRNLYIGFCNSAINLESALTITVQDGNLFQNNRGIYARIVGTGAPVNLIRLLNVGINDNAYYGVDYDQGSLLTVTNCDLEGNGTAAVCTGNPASGSISATLTAPWPLVSGGYSCFFPDGETRIITFTHNSTAINWVSGGGALSNTQSAAWIGTPTGALHIGGSLNASPTFGLGQVSLQNNWFEGNLGGWAVQVDAPNAGQSTDIAIRGGMIAASANGLALNVDGATDLSIENVKSPSPSDTWDLTATRAYLKKCGPSILTDTGISIPTYIDVTTNAGIQVNGRVTSFTASMTGLTGAATGTVLAIQQGKTVHFIFPNGLSGTSNSGTCTITGLSASLWPSADRQLCMVVLDNGLNVAGIITIGASGLITLTKAGGAFTSSGTKGIGGITTPPYDL